MIPIQPFMGNTAIPTYLKYSAVGMLLVTYFGVLGYAGFVLITQGQNNLPSWVAFIIGTGLTQALNLISQHVSSSVGEQATTQAAINQAAISAMERSETHASSPTA
jgi:hypothetical protein